MKKTIIALTVAGLAQLSVMAQGTFNFSTTVGLVWDNTGASSVLTPTAGTYNIGFLIGSVGQTPSVDSILTSTPTNTPQAVISAADWTAILTDPNFVLATNYTTSALISTPNTGGLSKGKFAGGTVQVNGTSAAGGNEIVFVVAWAGSITAPTAIGWSAPINYAYGSNIGTPTSFQAQGLTAFGIDTVGAVPEPSTMALAAIGGASLLLFRRRK